MKTMTGAWGVALVIVAGLIHGTADAQRSVLKEFEDAFVKLSEDVRPSVVEISAETNIPDRERRSLTDMFRFFGQPGPDEDDSESPFRPGPTATASGFIYDTLGHIVTNNHVVRDSSKLTVTLWNGEEREAEVVGQDPGADLAVIKIDPEGLDLKPVRLGDSDLLRVGQFAIAMGSPSGLTGSFSYGHVTALGRESLALRDDKLRFQNFIQTDAAINLGNSGGPLCNIDGEVIGVNVAIVFRANSIGFAIPISRVKSVVPQLIASGRVVRGWLGVSIDDIQDAALRADQEVEDFMDAYNLPDRRGAYVQALTPGGEGPGESAGLRPDDVIREIDGGAIEDPMDLINRVSDLDPDTVVMLSIWRKGKPMDLKVTIGEFPGMLAARYGRDYFGMHVLELAMPPQALERMGLEEQPADFYVVEVVPDSPADAAGIHTGDVILEIAHEETTRFDRFKEVMLKEGRPGKTLLLRVQLLSRVGAEPRKVYLKIPDDYEMK